MEYFDLGSYSRAVTTRLPEAQRWFDRGLIWYYAFNHEEALACFDKARKADPDCAMAHWGAALAVGPNYNKEWEIFDDAERRDTIRIAHEAIAAARASRAPLQPVETALIEALAVRYPDTPETEDFAPWQEAFTQAMMKVQAEFPDDLDVGCITAEAMMTRTPWLLWDLSRGVPAEDSMTGAAQSILEGLFDRFDAAWWHPGLLHMYIHLMEMSPWPELALRHGDRLVDIAPEAAHLIHMASHIDVLCGEYENVLRRNRIACRVDRGFEDFAGAQNFYTLYRIHNVHFMAYGAMFLGRPEGALEAARELERMLPDHVIRHRPAIFEPYSATRMHVLIRFGMWQAAVDLAMPKDEDLYLHTTAAMRQGRAIALANLGRHAEAQAERDKALRAAEKVPEDYRVFNNTSGDILRVGEAMMDGEMAYKSGRIEEGLEHLRRSVRLDDALLYSEPWGWMQPTRHALGALLLEQGLLEEAEAVYRADLGLDDTLARACQHPRNIWALHGLHECLLRRGEEVEIRHIRRQLDLAQARADIRVTASCLCRTNRAA